MNQKKENNIVPDSLSLIYCFSLFIISVSKTENAESDLEGALPLFFAITFLRSL